MSYSCLTLKTNSQLDRMLSLININKLKVCESEKELFDNYQSDSWDMVIIPSIDANFVAWDWVEKISLMHVKQYKSVMVYYLEDGFDDDDIFESVNHFPDKIIKLPIENISQIASDISSLVVEKQSFAQACLNFDNKNYLQTIAELDILKQQNNNKESFNHKFYELEGLVLMKLCRYQEAQNSFIMALRLSGQPRYLFLQIQSLFLQKKFHEALNLIDNNKNIIGNYNLTKEWQLHLNVCLGNKDVEQKLLDGIKNLEPSFVRLRYLGYYYLYCEKFDLSEKYFRKALIMGRNHIGLRREDFVVFCQLLVYQYSAIALEIKDQLPEYRLIISEVKRSFTNQVDNYAVVLLLDILWAQIQNDKLKEIKLWQDIDEHCELEYFSHDAWSLFYHAQKGSVYLKIMQNNWQVFDNIADYSETAAKEKINSFEPNWGFYLKRHTTLVYMLNKIS